MIERALRNWRTTSLGLTTIASAIINLCFSIKNQVDDQTIWMLTVTNVLVGIGLIFSGDSATSANAHAESQVQIAELKQKVDKVPEAIQTGDVSKLTKSEPALTLKP